MTRSPDSPAALRVLAVVALVGAVAVPCSPAAAVAPASPATPTRGVWPLQPRPEVVRRFEAPGSAWGAGHRGVDLRGSVGQTVHAAEAGRVAFAGRVAGVGVVAVAHLDGTRTSYQPVARSVAVGDEVAAGDVLGTLALAGSHCFPAACLHWGLLDGVAADGRYLDPLRLVGGGPVRLLPLTGPLGAMADSGRTPVGTPRDLTRLAAPPAPALRLRGPAGCAPARAVCATPPGPDLARARS